MASQTRARHYTEWRYIMATKEQIRKRESYRQWKYTFDYLVTCDMGPQMHVGQAMDVCSYFHQKLDRARAFGSQRNSDASMESLGLLYKDLWEEWKPLNQENSHYPGK